MSLALGSIGSAVRCSSAWAWPGGVGPHAREGRFPPLALARRGPPKIRFGRRPTAAVLPPPLRYSPSAFHHFILAFECGSHGCKGAKAAAEAENREEGPDRFRREPCRCREAVLLTGPAAAY
eukprot:scaffold252_cov20-Tisochrysis_lutea.AAC.1